MALLQCIINNLKCNFCANFSLNLHGNNSYKLDGLKILNVDAIILTCVPLSNVEDHL